MDDILGGLSNSHNLNDSELEEFVIERLDDYEDAFQDRDAHGASTISKLKNAIYRCSMNRFAMLTG
jgi:hypothetical protein